MADDVSSENSVTKNQACKRYFLKSNPLQFPKLPVIDVNKTPSEGPLSKSNRFEISLCYTLL